MTRRLLRMALAATLVLALALAAGCGGRSSAPVAERPPGEPPAGDPEPPPEDPPPEPEGEPSPLSGLRFPPEALRRRPVMVVFDNHPNARPQTGLGEAEIVYELLVEGGITRFLALYLGPEVGMMGPVRSIRHYFLDLALGHDAVLVYVGQSPRAEVEIKELRVPGLNEISNGGAFWRSTTRPRPHNLYTSTEFMRTAVQRAGLERETAPEEGPFAFRPEPPAEPADSPSEDLPRAARLSVAYPGFLGFRVHWEYDAERGVYVRSMGDTLHVDGATLEPLAFKTVILLELRAVPVPGDEVGRLEMNWVGSGKLRIFENGTVREGRWAKTTRRALPRFLEAGGAPLVLDPGRVWIMVVPLEAKVTVE